MNTCSSHVIRYLEISEFMMLRQRREKITKAHGNFSIKIQYSFTENYLLEME